MLDEKKKSIGYKIQKFDSCLCCSFSIEENESESYCTLHGLVVSNNGICKNFEHWEK